MTDPPSRDHGDQEVVTVFVRILYLEYGKGENSRTQVTDVNRRIQPRNLAVFMKWILVTLCDRQCWVGKKNETTKETREISLDQACRSLDIWQRRFAAGNRIDNQVATTFDSLWRDKHKQTLETNLRNNIHFWRDLFIHFFSVFWLNVSLFSLFPPAQIYPHPELILLPLLLLLLLRPMLLSGLRSLGVPLLDTP